MRTLTTKQEIASFYKEHISSEIKDWALVTAKGPQGYNTLTVSWWMIGKLWEWVTLSVFIKPSRYTYQFMEESNYFTVSYFKNDYIPALSLLGSKSGRDGDKIAESGLHVIEEDNYVTYEEASITFICEKIYYNDLDLKTMPEKCIDTYYNGEAPHRMYVGKIIEVRIND